MIDPKSIAFDIDGVVADTMTMFLDIARRDYNITDIRYEDITSYALEECIPIQADILDAIISKLIDKHHTQSLKPMPGSAEVLTRLGKCYAPLLFVTARMEMEPILQWLLSILPLNPSEIEVIATGSFDKAHVLKNRNIAYFVEDRLETCFPLSDAGITPVLFRQPWNRKPHPFAEVGDWQELESLIEFSHDCGKTP